MYQMLRSLNFSLGTLTVLERSLWEWEPVLWPPLNLHSLEHKIIGGKNRGALYPSGSVGADVLLMWTQNTALRSQK